MQRKRDGLVPIGEAFSDLDGPVKAIYPADQVSQLVSASESDPDLGFMARMMVLRSLPRSNPGSQKESKHVSGPYSST